ncbi:hypothetical protein [Hoeflea alexandrii]|uniref:hypothetical protein n=1 Tax=Hoeflea alexandrii TaxID=288436 RepID=UPI0022AF6842|nr:hypothetical protein [Hoeflea alexandrii]MCZ4292373.1 hypothetical protein [Hoeflea alexandrii]
MSNFGSPAHNATMGMGAGMMILAAAGTGLANSLINAQIEANDRRYDAAYGDALSSAVAHADSMDRVNDIAMQRVRDLEAQVRSLTAACAQRQGCIDRMKARLS